jgi:hypothetical protein
VWTHLSRFQAGRPAAIVPKAGTGPRAALFLVVKLSSGADQVVGPASAGTGGKRVAATIKEMGRLS